MEFTREQLEAIEYNALGDDNNAWVSQLADGTEFGFTVSSLAAFALNLLERAESAEAERDILAWANRNMGAASGDTGKAVNDGWYVHKFDARGKWISSDPKESYPYTASVKVETGTGVRGARPDPIRAAADAYRETEAELREMGERLVREGCECSKREPKGEWVGDGEWWSEPVGELLTSEPSRPHDSLVWAILLSQVARGDRAYPCGFALEVLIQDVDRLLDIWRKRWPEPEA